MFGFCRLLAFVNASLLVICLLLVNQNAFALVAPEAISVGSVELVQEDPDLCVNTQARRTDSSTITETKVNTQGGTWVIEHQNLIMPHTQCRATIVLEPGIYTFAYEEGQSFPMNSWGAQQYDGKKAYVKVVPPSEPVQFSSVLDFSRYDIYYGDVTGFGDDKDIYFHAKDEFVILHGDIATPILLPHKPSFVFYHSGGSHNDQQYSEAFTYRASDAQLATFQKADVNNQLAFGDVNGDGVDDVFIKGRSESEPALIVSSASVGNLPSEQIIYDRKNGDEDFRVSALSSKVVLRDINGDGLADLVYEPGVGFADWEYISNYGTFSTSIQFAEIPDYPSANLPGASSGEFRVDESGAATYSLSIDVPQGTAGVKPTVGIHYSSTRGDGLLGQGWSLSAHSSITPCRKTLLIDGQAERLHLDQSRDALCFNGKRLIEVSQNLYRLQLNGFDLIKRVGDYFVMEGKDGSVRFFGYTSNSVEKGITGGQPMQWAESKSCDSVGNCVDYIYSNIRGNTLLLKEIMYAYGSGGSPNARIRFYYEDHPESRSRYVAGNLVVDDQRLHSIHVYNSVDGAEHELRSYNLYYKGVTPQNAYARSYLDGIQECVGSSCLKPTRFNWLHNTGLEFATNVSYETQLLFERGDQKIPQLIPLDFDGDGYQDIAWIEYDDEYGEGDNEIRGRVRHARFDPESQEYKHMWFEGASDADIYISANSGENVGVMRDRGRLILQALDYNSDGKMDLAIYKNGYDQWSIYPSVPNTSGSAVSSLWRLSSAHGETVSSVDMSSVLVDVDSDGQLDILSYGFVQKLKSHAGGSAQFPNRYSGNRVSLTPAAWQYQAKPFLDLVTNVSQQEKVISSLKELLPAGDLDGDGSSDVVLIDRQVIKRSYGDEFSGFYEQCKQVGEHYFAMTNASDGNQFTQIAYLGSSYQTDGLKLSDCHMESDRSLLKHISFPDANGDGYADLVISTDEDVRFFLNTGAFDAYDPSTNLNNPFSGFSVTADGRTITGGQKIAERGSVPSGRKLGQNLYVNFIDINGDGHVDFLSRRISYYNGSINHDSFHYKVWRPSENQFANVYKPLTVKWNSNESTEGHHFFDADGNGHIDHVRSYYHKLEVRTNQVSGFNDVVDQITTGLGAITSIEYQQMHSSDHYLSLQEQLQWEEFVPSSTYIEGKFGNIFSSAILDNQRVSIPTDQYYAAIRSPFNNLSSNDQSFAGVMSSPVFEMISPMPIVTKITGDTPGLSGSYGNWGSESLTQTSSIEYFYSLSRVQASGVGHLGFRSIATRDDVNQSIVETRYRQDWPFIGLPETTITYEPHASVRPGGNLASLNAQTIKRNQWELQGWSSSWPELVDDGNTLQIGVIKPFIAESEEVAFSYVSNSTNPYYVVAEQGGGDWCSQFANSHLCQLFPHSSSQKVLNYQNTEQEIDEYGNVLQLITKESYQDIEKTVVTDNVYGSGSISFSSIEGYSDKSLTSYKALGRITESTVTTTQNRAGNTSQIENTSLFEYYNSGAEAGLLKKETAFSSTSTVDSQSPWDSDDLYQVTKEYQYDEFGNASWVDTIAKRVAFDFSGNIDLTVTGDITRTVRQEYDASGRFVDTTIKVVGDDERLIEIVESRSENGAPTRISNDLNQLVVQTEYDVLGREIVTYDNVGENQSEGSRTETHYRHCSGGQCPAGTSFYIEKVSSLGAKSRTYLDTLGRTIRESSLGHDGTYWVHVDTDYDRAGRVARVSQPFKNGESVYWTESDYDELGRVITSKAANGGENYFRYNGYETTTINPAGREKRELRNPLGELVLVADGDSEVFYDYNARGDLSTITTGRNLLASANDVHSKVELVYDALGRKVSMIDPNKGTWHYRYNAFGELLWQRDGKGQVVINRYDEQGRMLERTDFKSTGAVENHTRWYYDGKTHLSNTEVDNYIGQVSAIVHRNTNLGAVNCSVAGGARECILSEYDQYGRATSTTSHLFADGRDLGQYTSQVVYNHQGQVDRQYDVLHNTVKHSNNSQFTSGIINHYGPIGQLEAIEDIASNDEIYRVTDANTRGQVKNLLLANGVVTSYSYDDATGLLLSKIGSASSTTVQSVDYTWDILGNLKTRENLGRDAFGQTRNIQESFCYDISNQLVRAYRGTTDGNCGGAASSSFEYTQVDYSGSGGANGFGNIYSKLTHLTDGSTRGMSQYTYGTPNASGQYLNGGPNAVTGAYEYGMGPRTYEYDANGNMSRARVMGLIEKEISYSTFDKPESIERTQITVTQGIPTPSVVHTTEFAYGSGRSRYWRKDTNSESGSIVETLYLGNVERITRDNKVVWKRYLGGVAIYEVETSTNNVQLSNTSVSKTFIHKDHLGSIDALTNFNGQVIETMSFDPWGQRRDAETGAHLNTAELFARMDWQQTLSGEHTYGAYHLSEVGRTTKGFTGHEMLDEAGLIHMNGRLYDPLLGRFIQADPFVQAADNPFSYNRYSYVFNNPLSATDPSGYISSFFYEAKKVAGLVLAAAYTAACYGSCSAAAYAFIAAWGAAVAGADGKGILIAAVSAYVGASIGASDTLKFMDKVAASAVVGGVTAAITGGNIGHSMVSAGIGSFFGSQEVGEFLDNAALQVGLAAIVGGTQSELTGGKFKNGAGTAAFMALVSLGAGKSDNGDLVDEFVDYESPVPENQTDKVTKNKALEHMISVSEDAEGNIAIEIKGTVSNTDLDEALFAKWVESINSLDGSSGKFGWIWDRKTITLSVDISIANDPLYADFYIQLSDNGKTYVQMPAIENRGGEWAQRAISVNPNQPWLPLNGAHEFGHLLGFSHSGNNGCGLMSYCYKYGNGPVPTADLRRVRAGDLRRLAERYR